MYSAITKTNLPPNGWLLLPGAGGGLGHLFVLSKYLQDELNTNSRVHRGVQVAKARGYRVIAVDTYVIIMVTFGTSR